MRACLIFLLVLGLSLCCLSAPAPYRNEDGQLQARTSEDVGEKVKRVITAKPAVAKPAAVKPVSAVPAPVAPAGTCRSTTSLAGRAILEQGWSRSENSFSKRALPPPTNANGAFTINLYREKVNSADEHWGIFIHETGKTTGSIIEAVTPALNTNKKLVTEERADKTRVSGVHNNHQTIITPLGSINTFKAANDLVIELKNLPLAVPRGAGGPLQGFNCVKYTQQAVEKMVSTGALTAAQKATFDAILTPAEEARIIKATRCNFCPTDATFTDED